MLDPFLPERMSESSEASLRKMVMNVFASQVSYDRKVVKIGGHAQ